MNSAGLKEATPNLAEVSNKKTKVKTKIALKVGRSGKFKPNCDEENQWSYVMKDIEETGSISLVFGTYRKSGKLSKEMVVGTLMQYKKLKDWKSIVEVGFFFALLLPYFLFCARRVVLLLYYDSGEYDGFC